MQKNEEEEIKINYDSLTKKMKDIISKNELILGIDFGTTYSCASIVLDGKIIVIQNSLGKRTTPSYVVFLENNKICVGELAKLQPSYEENIIYNIKRLIGKNLNDEGIESMKKKLVFKIKEDKAFDLLKIQMYDQEYYPEQIAAMILKKIIYDSEHYLSLLLGKEIKINNSVITVPVYFNEKQKKSILNAAKIINLKVKKILDEPTAASLAYYYKNKIDIGKNIIVIDFGGGTLDITLLYLGEKNNSADINILYTAGDSNFGGEDFDDIIMERCISCIKNKDMLLDNDQKKVHNVRLKRACENAKIRLSKIKKTRIFIEEYLPFIDIDYSLNKEEFERICQPLFEEFKNRIINFLRDNKIDIKNIGEVIPIGSSMFIPKIKEILENIFEKNINYNLNPKEVVAEGAAIQGGILSNIIFFNVEKEISQNIIKNHPDPPDSINFINKLKEIENTINYVDINLYKDTIKDLIMKTEYKIIKLSKRENIDFDKIKENNRLILKNFRNFIKNKLEQSKNENYEKKLILSYIKYYFMKLSDYFQTYNDYSFRNTILKDNIIDNILNEIQYYNPDIIFEIIEDFSDEKEIFEKCIVDLIQNLYGKFTENFENKNFKQIVLDDLQKIKKEIDVILTLFSKIETEEIPNEIKYVKPYLEAFQTKIKIKEFILDFHRNIKYGVLSNEINYFSQTKDKIREYEGELNIDEDLMNELYNLFPNKTENSIYDKKDMFLNQLENLKCCLKNEKEAYLYEVFKEYKVISKENKEKETKYKVIDFAMEWKNKLYETRFDDQMRKKHINDTLLLYKQSYEIIKERKNDKKLEEVYQKIISIIDSLK